MELNAEKVLSFVLSRETAEGGFSFAQTTPRTLDDTYYALKTFEVLGYDYQSRKTLKYIADLRVDRFTPPKIIYQFACLFHLLRIGYHRYLAELIALRLSSSNHSLKDLYSLIFSLRYLHSVPEVSINHALRSRISRLSISDLRTMDNVLRQLLLMRQLHIPFDRTAYVEWIRSSQNGDGGFGFYPSTSSFLENTYYALKALSLLESSPSDLQECKSFIQGCQASNGGFGRQSISVPRLDSTYHAVSSLLRLEKMEHLHLTDSSRGAIISNSDLHWEARAGQAPWEPSNRRTENEQAVTQAGQCTAESASSCTTASSSRVEGGSAARSGLSRGVPLCAG